MQVCMGVLLVIVQLIVSQLVEAILGHQLFVAQMLVNIVSFFFQNSLNCFLFQAFSCSTAVYADVNSDCVRPNFLFGVSSNSRKYTIKVSESFFSNKAGLFQFTNFFLAPISFPEQLLSIIRRMNIKNKYLLKKNWL